jgi:hypothetical protein
MCQLRIVVFLLLAAVFGVGETAQQGRPGSPAGQPSELVQRLYRQVVARHPTGLPRGADMNAQQAVVAQN